MSKHIKFIVCSVFVCLSLTFSGCLPKEETVIAPPMIKPSDLNLKTIKVTKGAIEKQLIFKGFVVPSKNTLVDFKSSSGTLSKINCAVGDKVKKGQVLAELDTESLKLNIKQTELRYEKLASSYKALCDNPNTSASEKEGVKLDLELQKMQLDKLKAQLSSLILTSPTDGEIVFKYADAYVGGAIATNKPLFIISDTTNLMVEGELKEVSDIKVGMGVKGPEGQAGKVTDIRINSFYTMISKGTADLMANHIRVELAGLNSKKMGEPITVGIVLDTKDNALKLPKNAVKTINNGSYVTLVQDGNKVEKLVGLGVEGTQEVEILEGLSEGDEVLAN